MTQNDELVSGDALHREVIEKMVLTATRTVWIATANLKDMHIRTPRGYRPILEQLDRLARQNVSFRIIHSDLPSRYFRRTLDKYPRLTGGGLELQICPRSHWKMVVVDGRQAYMGSANFTGAGLGAKKPTRRNFEIGVVSSRAEFVSRLAKWFDQFWMGDECGACAFRDTCPDPIL